MMSEQRSHEEEYILSLFAPEMTEQVTVLFLSNDIPIGQRIQYVLSGYCGSDGRCELSCWVVARLIFGVTGSRLNAKISDEIALTTQSPIIWNGPQIYYQEIGLIHLLPNLDELIELKKL